MSLLKKISFIIIALGLTHLSTPPQASFNPFKSIKKGAKKIGKTAKKGAKKIGKTAKKATKNPVKSLKKGAKKIGKTVKDTAKKAGSMAKNLAKAPICIKDAIAIGKGVLTLVEKKFPPNICVPIQDFTKNGCWAMEGMLERIGPQAKMVKKMRTFLTGTVCGCINEVGSLTDIIRSAQFTKESCKKVDHVKQCCGKILNFPPFKQLCSIAIKTVGKAESKICKAIAGTCPALVASEGVLAVKIVAEVAAMVAASEVGPEEYVAGILNILSDLHNMCINAKPIQKKKCCKLLGPAQKACKPILSIANGVCNQLECPFQIIELIQNPSCTGFQKLMKSHCCDRIKKMPKPFGQAFGKLCSIAQSMAKKTLGTTCKMVGSFTG